MTGTRTLLTLGAVLAIALLACGDDATPRGTQPPDGPATGLAPTTATAPPPTAQPAPAATTATTTTATVAPAEPTASTGATPADQLPVVEFLRADGAVVALPIEVPPRREYGIGLSGRYALDGRGMLFDYGVPERDGPFWMKNTHVDLDIAFIGADLRIVAIRQMEAESLDYVYSGSDYQYAVEAPAGWYEAHGVAAGDAVRFTFDTPSALGLR